LLCNFWGHKLLARFHLCGATISGVLGWCAITFWQCLRLIAGASARRVEYRLGGTLLLTALPSTTLLLTLPTTGRLLAALKATTTLLPSTTLLLTLPRRTKAATHYTRLRPTSLLPTATLKATTCPPTLPAIGIG
jgi:hypothetical protein